MPVIMLESTADGPNFWFAEDEKTAKKLNLAIDEEMGDPGEVDEWGGWNYDWAPNKDEKVESDMSKDEIVARLLEEGQVPAKFDDVVDILAERSTKSVFDFCITDSVYDALSDL